MKQNQILDVGSVRKKFQWVGKLMCLLVGIAFIGFSVCSLTLLHTFQTSYGVYYSALQEPGGCGVAQETIAAYKDQVVLINSSFINGTDLMSERRIAEVPADDHGDDDFSGAEKLVAAVSLWNTNFGPAERTDLNHIVFGIGASARLWETRKEYVKLWWRGGKMRGYVWFDEWIPSMDAWDRGLPPWKISANTSGFKYTHKQGSRSAIRISRIVSESFRLGLADVRWFVMGDDDTVFVAENLVTVLSKYDHTQFYYIGGNSESHIQNQYFTYNMAFGGGGFAISYPLAKALERMQDKCLERYQHLFGSDDRVQACVAELGVGFTREPGFHQLDITGNPFGLLAAHPIAPLVSLHHLDMVDPLFRYMDRVQSLRHLLNAASFDPAAVLQQSICYDRRRRWSFSVSMGYAVQIFRGIVSPRELEMSARTFSDWQHRDDFLSYPFNTRPISRKPCQRPLVFQLSNIYYQPSTNTVLSNYTRQEEEEKEKAMPVCGGRISSPHRVQTIQVSKDRGDNSWLKSPRRNCCKIKFGKRRSKQIEIKVADCKDGEIISMYPGK